MPLIPLECPSCEAELRIDSDESAALCSSCGKPFVVKDALVQNYIRVITALEKIDASALAYDEFQIENNILKRYNGASSDVVIPDSVTIIGGNAFEDRKDLISVRLPDSVTEIEDNAFSGCDKLRSVSFSSALKKIGSYAFSECTGLRAVDLPASIEEIGPYAFSGCFMLGAVRMPSSLSGISETAFMGDKDVQFFWPDDWADKQLDKLRIVAPSQGGLLSLFGSEDQDGEGCDTLLYLGTSDLGMYVESNKFNFYTYHGFMNQFSLEKNNRDPYLLRVSVDNAQLRYDAIADIQKSYSELIGLLDLAGISRSVIETINIPHFIWKQGKRLNDYKVTDIGAVQVLQIRLIQK